MRDLLLGIAIAYFSFSPEGQKTAKKVAETLKKRYMAEGKKEAADNESKTAQP